MNIFIEHLERINLLPHQKIELMILSAQTIDTLPEEQFKTVSMFLREGTYILPITDLWFAMSVGGPHAPKSNYINIPEEVLSECMTLDGWLEVLKWAIAQVKSYRGHPRELMPDEQIEFDRICYLFNPLMYNHGSICSLLKFCLKRFEFNPELGYHAMLEQWHEPGRFLDKPYDTDEFQERVWQQISPYTRKCLQQVPLNAWQFLAIGEWAFTKIEGRIMSKMVQEFKEAIADWKALHPDS